MCVTASHRTTDFALLDRVSREVSTTAADLVAADPAIRGAVLLATCNRFEAYLDIDDSSAELATNATVDVMSRASGVSSADLREVASMRLLLESHGLKESFQRGDLEWEGRVVAAYHKLATMERRMAANDSAPAETWRQFDWAFHVALISACGSRLLLETYESICDKYLRYQMIAAIFRGDVAADEHQVLLESALARDWKRAQRTLTTHVDDCVTQMASALDAM